MRFSGVRSPDGVPVLYSGLADGADCEVAQLAVWRGWELVAVLAAPEADFAAEHETQHGKALYEKLLDCAQRIIIAAPSYTDSPERYCMVGDQILGPIDHLIAVWDGDSSNPKAGGTAWVVAKFLHTGSDNLNKLHHLKVNRG